LPVPAFRSQAQPARRAWRTERTRDRHWRRHPARRLRAARGLPLPLAQAVARPAAQGLIDLLIDFRRGRDGGDKLDIHGFSLVLEAAWRRQSDQHRQNQGKGRCVDEADAITQTGSLIFSGLITGSEERKVKVVALATRDRSYLSRVPLCKPSAFHHNSGRCAGAAFIALELGPRSGRDLAKGLRRRRCRFGGDDGAPFV
jgi:hypothetical protein